MKNNIEYVQRNLCETSQVRAIDRGICFSQIKISKMRVLRQNFRSHLLKKFFFILGHGQKTFCINEFVYPPLSFQVFWL